MIYAMPWKDRVNILYYVRCCCWFESCRKKQKNNCNEEIDNFATGSQKSSIDVSGLESNGCKSSLGDVKDLDDKLETTL